MSRLMWFAAGAAAGVGGSMYAKRKAREAAERYRPVNVAKGALDRFTEAVREGRAAMVAREAELRARQDAPSLAPVPTTAPSIYVVEVPATDAVRDRRAGPRRRSRR
jgi:hypothetical protein